MSGVVHEVQVRVWGLVPIVRIATPRNARKSRDLPHLLDDWHERSRP